MEKCKFKFDSYILGFICLLIVCILPTISPIVYFFNNTSGVMPYLLIFVSITGILYEFYIPNKEAEKILKIEHIIVYGYSFFFLFVDLVMLFIRADMKTYSYNWVDYCLIGYVLVPAIIIGIETYRSAKEYYVNSANNDTDDKIAIGNATNV